MVHFPLSTKVPRRIMLQRTSLGMSMRCDVDGEGFMMVDIITQ